MKKSLSLLVAIAMVFSMFATLVSADTESAGEKLLKTGIIKGTNEGLEEGSEWLRQDVTVLIARLLNKVDEAEAHANTHGFEDLDSKFYNGYVSWAKENNFFIGKSATKFGTGESITNQEFATVLLRVFNSLQGVTEEVDYSSAFETAVELGLANKDLDPKANAIRGDIYVSLVSALDYKINGKKVGTILGLPGYENNFAVSSAKATNSKTVAVEFSQEVGTVLASNFLVKEKDSESFEVISAVSAAENVVTLTLFDALENGKTYVVEASGIANKDASAALEETVSLEFTYNKTVAKTVTLNQTSVEFGQEISYTIRDEYGNDVTPDFNIADSVQLQTSNDSVIHVVYNKLTARTSPPLDATQVHYAVVNVIVTVDAENDTKIETGPVAVQVKQSVAVANGIGKVSFESDFTKDAVLSIFKTAANNKSNQLFAEVLGADGKKIELANPKFKSLNPTVLVVDESGEAHGVKAGSATVVVTAEFNGKTVSKSVTVTVKEDPKLSAIDVDKSSVKVVKGSGISHVVKVTLKDQYGDVYEGEGQQFTVSTSKDNVVANYNAKATPVTETAVNGVFELVIADVSSNETDAAVLTVKAGNFSKTISVSIVKGGALVGYAVEIDNLKIDSSDASSADNSHLLKERSAIVKVYQKDSAGNYLKEVTSLDGVTVTRDKADADSVLDVPFVNADGKIEIKAKANKAATEKIYVSVNGVTVATYDINVVNTTPTLSRVVQAKNAINVNVGNNIETALFGTNKDGAAFVGYDQYGDKIQIPSGQVIYSANKEIVDITAKKAGTVLLTVVVKDAVYTITVKVVN